MSGDQQTPSDPGTSLQATTYYTFNETGNIMMASTYDGSNGLPASVQDVFAEVSVFFAAMTKAISTTINPATNKPYSLYDYAAVNHVIQSSGLFILVTEETMDYTSSSVGADFSKELLTAVLSLADGGASVASFAQGLISSAAANSTDGKIHVGASGSDQKSKVCNITFVCEYLLGMPAISAIVAYVDLEKVKDVVDVGPCFKGQAYKEEITIYKDTYLFVTPTFIKKYSGDLDSVISDPSYTQFISYLQSNLTNMAIISSVTDGNSTPVADNTLKADATYNINGFNFGASATGNTVYLGLRKSGSTANKFTMSKWSTTQVQFKKPASGFTATGSHSLYLYRKGSDKPIAITAEQFTVAS